MSGDDDFADLEPVDLEPVDPEPGRDAARFDRDGGPRRVPRWLWIAVGACGLVVWAAIALTTHHDSSPGTTASTTPSPTPTSVVPVVDVDHVAVAGEAMREGLARIGVERFASVIDGRLYTFDSTLGDSTLGDPTLGDPTLVPVPGSHVTISDQSGSSLLAWTVRETLVTTRPGAIRPLRDRVTAIRAITPGRWWLVNGNGTIQRDPAGRIERVPNGLHVVGAVARGFVAYDDGGRWLLWPGTVNAPISLISFPFPVDQFLVAGVRRVVFLGGCGYTGCNVYIYDADQSRLAQIRLNGVPAFGAFSPDGTRLAIATNQGDVYLLDSANGETLARTRSGAPSIPTLPLSWTADGRALIVVQAGRIEIRRAIDGAPTASIEGTDGVEQLVALP
jgi:hypothetical protein